MENMAITKHNSFDSNYYPINSQSNSLVLKYKRKRDLFTSRIDSLLTLPSIITSKFTNSSFLDDYSIPLCIKKTKAEPLTRGEKDLKDIKPLHISTDLDQEISLLKDEINEIENELEIFKRTNRKKKMIKLMEKIAEHIDDDMIDINELTDYRFYGNKICNIENEYIEKQRSVKSSSKRFSEYTNRLLIDDDEIFVGKSLRQCINLDNEAAIQRERENTHRIFKIHQANKENK